MTQKYKNTTPKSCVYDALKMIGINTKKEWINGITTGEAIEILKKNKYKILTGVGKVEVKITRPFIIIRNIKNNVDHMEAHTDLKDILEYNDIILIAL